jgi:host factor-I protein
MPTPRKSSTTAGTGHEALYLKSLAERQVRVEIKLRDGERLHGWIEYFDDNMIRLTREDGPNLFVYKHHIHTISEGPRPRSNGAVTNGAAKLA